MVDRQIWREEENYLRIEDGGFTMVWCVVVGYVYVVFLLLDFFFSTRLMVGVVVVGRRRRGELYDSRERECETHLYLLLATSSHSFIDSI